MDSWESIVLCNYSQRIPDSRFHIRNTWSEQIKIKNEIHSSGGNGRLSHHSQRGQADLIVFSAVPKLFGPRTGDSSGVA